MSTEEGVIGAVTARLRKSLYRTVRQLSYEMTEDGVILYGRVSTFHEKQLAQEAIRDIEGVCRLDYPRGEDCPYWSSS